MTDDERKARAASWDDDQPDVGIVNGLTLVAAIGFTVCFFWRLFQVLA